MQVHIKVDISAVFKDKMVLHDYCDYKELPFSLSQNSPTEL